LRNQHPNEGDASKSDFHPEKIPSVRFLLEVLPLYSQRAALRRKSLKISAFSATSARDAEYLSLI
jgi:hypothetical protein